MEFKRNSVQDFSYLCLHGKVMCRIAEQSGQLMKRVHLSVMYLTLEVCQTELDILKKIIECKKMNKNLISLLIMCGAYAVAELHNKKKSKRNRSMRTNPYLSERRSKGRFVKDFEDLKKHKQSFYENFHVDVETFNKIVVDLEPYLIAKRNKRPDDKISPKEKIAVVLEYFASGSLQRHMASIYRISKQHLGTIIDDVCSAICSAYKSYVPPMNKKEITKSANEFNRRWQFPNCIGAIDRKHVAVKAPPRAGSLFYNYKGYHSLLLMAASDGAYKFTYLDIGAYGSEGDANVFSQSKFGQDILHDDLDFPEDGTICGVKLPFFFVADDAFPLCKRIMKPYSGRRTLSDEELIFNYRLSRARRCIENAFGILCSKWLCLRRTMLCSPDRAQNIITACCLLHNYLMSNHKTSYCPSNFADHIDENGSLIEGDWRKNMEKLNDSLYGNFISSNRGRQAAIGKYVRNYVKNYMNSPVGSVPWQSRGSFVK